MTKLPPLPEQIANDYAALQDRIDTAIAEHLPTFFDKGLQCRKGCAECCIAFRVLPVEAAYLLAHLQKEKLVTEIPLESQQKTDRCRFLQHEACTIYPYRPIICRTQGLPLGYIDEEAGSIEVSCCPLNFDDEYAFEVEELFLMDSFNAELSELNARYCTSCGFAPLQRIPLSDVAKAKKS